MFSDLPKAFQLAVAESRLKSMAVYLPRPHSSPRSVLPLGVHKARPETFPFAQTLRPVLTCSEKSPRGVVHRQGVDELPGRGEDGASFKLREGERSVVGGDVQLEGGMDADKEAHGQDDQFPQLHGVHQGPGVLSHLHGQSL